MNTIHYWFLLKLLIVFLIAFPFLAIAIVTAWRESRKEAASGLDLPSSSRYCMTPSTPIAQYATGAGVVEPRHSQEASIDQDKRAA